MIDAIFAQVSITPDPSGAAIKEWLSVALYILGIICTVLGGILIVKQLREKPAEPLPQPMLIKADVEFVPVHVHDKAVAEIKAELLRHAGRRAEIYKQNEAHGKAISALQAETASQTRTIHQLSDQIERLPEKIKNLLLK